jgi:FtsP/CotA-like multicopper oxidase with cupredoxin domain
MDRDRPIAITRREALTLFAAAAGAAFLPLTKEAAARTDYMLIAAPGRAPLGAGPDGESAVWCYNGLVPGQLLKVPQGERVRIAFANQLPQDSTIHWHGLRVPNSMDGVPHVTQAPVAPGERFVYEFYLPDAGTYWYHPHAHSSEQTDRGLAAPFIVDEAKPPEVDRDIVWVIDDWRLHPNGVLAEGFDNMMDTGMAGRIGNWITLNGRPPAAIEVRAGERLRLRLINVANARIFGLEFSGHRPWFVALDGQPVESHEPPDGRVLLGPAQRADLILDLAGEPGTSYLVRDTFYPGSVNTVASLAYREDPPLRSSFPPLPVLAPNTQPEPDLEAAERSTIVFGGGMMGGMMMGGMMSGHWWAVNGVPGAHPPSEPLLELALGRSYMFSLVNDTTWFHPIHLHGHAFRVVSRNGYPTPLREWRDTVLLEPRSRADIAFVADNPGDWLIHCHIPEHMASGMTALIRVA